MFDMFGVFVDYLIHLLPALSWWIIELYHVFFDMRRGKFEIEFTRGGGWVWWSCCETRLTMTTKFPKQEVRMCQLKKQISGGRGNFNGRGDVDGAGMVGTLRAGHGGQPGGDCLAWDWCRWIIPIFAVVVVGIVILIVIIIVIVIRIFAVIVIGISDGSKLWSVYITLLGMGCLTDRLDQLGVGWCSFSNFKC